MAATSVVRARITETVKQEASAVAAQMGLTLSDIVRLTLTRVAKDHALPFDVRAPNAATRAAMGESRTLIATGRTRKMSAKVLFDELDQKAGKPKKSRATA